MSRTDGHLDGRTDNMETTFAGVCVGGGGGGGGEGRGDTWMYGRTTWKQILLVCVWGGGGVGAGGGAGGHLDGRTDNMKTNFAGVCVCVWGGGFHCKALQEM